MSRREYRAAFVVALFCKHPSFNFDGRMLLRRHIRNAIGDNKLSGTNFFAWEIRGIALDIPFRCPRCWSDKVFSWITVQDTSRLVKTLGHRHAYAVICDLCIEADKQRGENEVASLRKLARNLAKETIKNGHGRIEVDVAQRSGGISRRKNYCVAPARKLRGGASRVRHGEIGGRRGINGKKQNGASCPVR